MIQDADAEARRPLPMPDEVTAGFWDSLRAHRLSIQRCTSCGRLNHPPTLCCPSCGSESLAYQAVSGRGTLYSYTVVEDAPAPGFRQMVPFVVAVVELDEQPRLLMVSNLVGADSADMRIGAKVEIAYEDVEQGCTLPHFRPVVRGSRS